MVSKRWVCLYASRLVCFNVSFVFYFLCHFRTLMVLLLFPISVSYFLSVARYCFASFQLCNEMFCFCWQKLILCSLSLSPSLAFPLCVCFLFVFNFTKVRCNLYDTLNGFNSYIGSSYGTKLYFGTERFLYYFTNYYANICMGRIAHIVCYLK